MYSKRVLVRINPSLRVIIQSQEKLRIAEKLYTHIASSRGPQGSSSAHFREQACYYKVTTRTLASCRLEICGVCGDNGIAAAFAPRLGRLCCDSEGREFSWL